VAVYRLPAPANRSNRTIGLRSGTTTVSRAYRLVNRALAAVNRGGAADRWHAAVDWGGGVVDRGGEGVRGVAWGWMRPSIRSKGLWTLMGRQFRLFLLNFRSQQKIVNALKFENF
jgi:hypothetical protein